jgi:outer membrane protein assembly factor BamB
MKTKIERMLGMVAIMAAVFVAASPLAAQDLLPGLDWPEWRGSDRTGISEETGWAASFPGGSPKELWRRSVGRGCSSMSVVGNRVYTMGNTDDVETVYCLNADTGEAIWETSYDCKTAAKNFEGGPGATPTVDGNRVYTLSRMGHFHCLNAETGDVIWSLEARKDLGAGDPGWGFTCSALVVDDRLILNADAVFALDKNTGKVIWKTDKVGAFYSSPMRFMLDGKDLLAVFCAKGLVILETGTGKEVSRFPWKTSYDVNAVTPIVSGDKVFISSGYNTGCALVRLSDGNLEEIWRNKNMRNHFNSSVLWKGNLYGFDESNLRCIGLEDGEEKWTQPRLGKGSLMIADGKMIIMGERGELVIAEAVPEEFREISRAEVLKDRCWVVPVLSHGQIYCRNNMGELVAIDVKEQETSPQKPEGETGG